MKPEINNSVRVDRSLEEDPGGKGKRKKTITEIVHKQNSEIKSKRDNLKAMGDTYIEKIRDQRKRS